MNKPFVHLWFTRDGFRCCRCCGIVLSLAPGKHTSGCRGVVHIATR